MENDIEYEANKETDVRGAIAYLRKLIAATSQEEWFETTVVGETKAERIATIVESAQPGGDEFHGVFIERDGESLTVAYTGNGERSQAHARFIMFAHRWLPMLLNELEARLEAIGTP